jgi:hypothetical protein
MQIKRSPEGYRSLHENVVEQLFIVGSKTGYLLQKRNCQSMFFLMILVNFLRKSFVVYFVFCIFTSLNALTMNDLLEETDHPVKLKKPDETLFRWEEMLTGGHRLIVKFNNGPDLSFFVLFDGHNEDRNTWSLVAYSGSAFIYKGGWLTWNFIEKDVCRLIAKLNHL